MKSILVRNVEPSTLERLKRLARSHNRSLHGEIHALLDQALRLLPDETEEELELFTVNTGRSSPWSREEIYGNDGR